MIQAKQRHNLLIAYITGLFTISSLLACELDDEYMALNDVANNRKNGQPTIQVRTADPFISILSPQHGANVTVTAGAPIVLTGETNVSGINIYIERSPGDGDILGSADTSTPGTWRFEYAPLTQGTVTFIVHHSNIFTGTMITERVTFDVNINTIAQLPISISPTGEPGNADSWSPAINADGRYVAYQTRATNIIPGTPPFPQFGGDIIRHDRSTGINHRVNVDEKGQRINADNLIIQLSADGNRVLFPGEGGNRLFVRDLLSNKLFIVPNSLNPYAASLSGNGRYVAFFSRGGGGRSRIYVYDLANSTLELEKEFTIINNQTWHVGISDNGHWLAFDATNGYYDNGVHRTDVFLLDRATNRTVEVSHPRFSGERLSSRTPSLSADGNYLSFISDSSDLVDKDENGQTDVFVYNRITDTIARHGETSSTYGLNVMGISDDGRITAHITDTADHKVFDASTQTSTLFIRFGDTVTADTRAVLSRDGLSLAVQGQSSTLFPEGKGEVQIAVASSRSF